MPHQKHLKNYRLRKKENRNKEPHGMTILLEWYRPNRIVPGEKRQHKNERLARDVKRDFLSFAESVPQIPE